MEWRKPHYSKRGKRVGINPCVRKLFNPVKHSKTPTLEKLMGSLYVTCGSACAFQYAVPTAAVGYATEDDVNVGAEEEVETGMRLPPPLKELLQLHGAALTVFCKDEVHAIEEATRSQADNSEWFAQRIGRITASHAHSAVTKYRKIVTHRNIGSMDNLVGFITGEKTLDPNLQPLKYGREMEPVARVKYAEIMSARGHKNLKTNECGLFVSPEHIYMAASPDAVVSCACCGEGLLEIKCPLKTAHSDPQSCPPAYLIRNDEGRLHLKPNHPYHTQVVMQLAVTNYKWCDFFVYTPHGYHVQRIYKHNFLNQMCELQQAASTIFALFIAPKLCPTTNTIPTPEIPAIDSSEPGSSTQQVHATANVLALVAASGSMAEPPPRKRRKTRRTVKKKKLGPVYLCEVCQEECKDEEDIGDANEQSVGCDQCYKWFHWGCVGFEGIDPHNWYCVKCADEMM